MKYKEYYSTLNKVCEDLEKNGVAVILDVLRSRECEKLAEEVWVATSCNPIM
jgi:hypothetical protein